MSIFAFHTINHEDDYETLDTEPAIQLENEALISLNTKMKTCWNRCRI